MKSHNISQAAKLEQMLETPVEKLIPRLAIPTIISMLVTSIYNMADTFFVSKISTSAAGAVGIIFSAMAIIQAVGFTLGMGSGNYISRCLGIKKTGEAERAASTAFFTAIGIGVLMAVFGLIFLEPLVYALGATPTIAPFACDYAMYILLAAPFMLAAFVMNNILRAQGNALYAMIGISTGSVLNIILDPILIFTFDMGISGAAIATMVGQLISFIILFIQCATRENCLKFKPHRFTPTPRMYGIILHAGLPSLCRQGISGLSSVILNFAAHPYGDAAIAAMSIVTRFMMFVNSALIGFGQGFQPVCGFAFGAAKYNRVLKAFWFCLKVMIVMLSVFTVITVFFSGQIVALFRREDAEVISIGTLALRLQLITLPIQSWIIMVNMFTQSIGYGFRSAIVAAAKQGLFLIPLLLILPHIFGLFGVQVAQPIADVLTFILSIIIAVPIIKELKQKGRENNELQI